MVRVGSPGLDDHRALPLEAVGVTLPAAGWDVDVLEQLDRFGALVVGPGLGRAPSTADAIRRLVAAAPVPTIVDGDGLTALGSSVASVLRSRSAPTVLTPHDGEFGALTGHRPRADRIAAARDLAATSGAVVLLKGAATVIAAPDGRVLISTAGDARLATAGSGDVLSGAIGALLGAGLDPLDAAAAGAFVHGRAGAIGHAHGLVASDLITAIPDVLDELAG
jgi:NAD(P)H-hydrate epimerase